MTDPIRIQKLTASSDKCCFQSIAEIHAREIQEGFLSTLGDRFLRKLYRALSACDDAFLLAATRDDEVFGFICCSTHTRRVYRRVLARHGFQLLPALIPRLLSPKRIWRILETLCYPFLRTKRERNENHDTCEDVLDAEILNFCVSRDSQGLGVGRQLFAAAVDEYRSRGTPQIRIVTGANQVKAQRFYDALGARRISHTQIHAGTSSVVYGYSIHDPKEISKPAA